MLVENCKPKQTSMFLVNILSCGLEMCIATVMICTPPRLLQAGMEERYMTMVLAVGPVLALICTPMIGSASDSSQGRFGRRRPFIWILSLGVILGLQVMPKTWSLAVLISPQHPQHLEAVLLAVAVSLIDFCINACLPLLMTLLSDLFPREEDNHRAFSVNSLMISLGGCFGFLLPAVDWNQAPIVTYLGGQETFVYALITIFLLICLLTTTFIPEDTGTRGGDKRTVTPLKSWRGRYCPPCTIITFSRCASVLPRMQAKWMHVPAILWRLLVAEVCSWMAVLSITTFFADFMGEGLYYGVPHAETESHKRKLYDEGVRVASLGLFLQCVVSGLCSVLIKSWIALLGARVVYMSGVVLLVFATALMSISDSVILVTVMVAATGYSFTTLHVVPYTLLCLYHSNKEVFFTSPMPRPPNPSSHTGGKSLMLMAGSAKVDTDGRQVPERGMCFDMALLDSAYLLSQVLTAMCLGSIVELAHSVRAYMASACCFSLLALFFSSKVVYSRADLQQ